MGLETFLNFQEALVFGRKIGSPPFMFPSPSLLASSKTGLESHFFLRRESRLKVRPGIPRSPSTTDVWVPKAINSAH